MPSFAGDCYIVVISFLPSTVVAPFKRKLAYIKKRKEPALDAIHEIIILKLNGPINDLNLGCLAGRNQA